MPVTIAFRFLGFALGVVVHLYLAKVFWRGGPLVERRRLLLAATSAAALWHTANAAALFGHVITPEGSGALLTALEAAGRAGTVLVPLSALHLAWAWAGLPAAAGVLVYAAAPLAWRGADWPVPAALAAAAALSLMAGIRAAGPTRHFFWWFAGAVALTVPAGGAGPDSSWLALASLAPPAVLSYFIYRYNLFALFIGSRALFTLALGAISALYLLLVRSVARDLEFRVDAFGSVLEVALALAAAIVWLPLYGWVTRVLARRAELYADFGKRVMEEAVKFLDLGERLAFLVQGIARTFGLSGALLATFREPRLQRGHGRGPLPDELLARLESALAGCPDDILHQARASDPALRALLEEAAFPYVFPLRYENALTGVMFVDPAPRRYLDTSETVLLELSRQISHSLEACRLADRKISLEKTLLAQEHRVALGDMAATIAHEVKNPLSSIRALAQLMREDAGVSARFGEDLSHIISETDRLNASVRQFLDFARPAPDQAGSADVSHLLETLARTLAREYAPAGVRVETAIEPGLQLSHADSRSLQQIVLNLALNAVQASPLDGRVFLEARRRGPDLILAVRDQGPGIPPALREKIFQPFFTTRQKGTGLGLAIVKKNVQQLGGQIEVQSPVADGPGTEMRVILPCA